MTQKLGHEPRQFTRFGDLLEQRDVDAVVIATPDFSHGTILKAALKAGKDVYVEKPMTIDLASARQRSTWLAPGIGSFRPEPSGAAMAISGRRRRTSPRRARANQPRLRGRGLQRAPLERSVAGLVEADVDWPAYLLHLPPRPFDAQVAPLLAALS